MPGGVVSKAEAEGIRREMDSISCDIQDVESFILSVVTVRARKDTVCGDSEVPYEGVFYTLGVTVGLE